MMHVRIRTVRGVIRGDSKDPQHFAFLIFKRPLTAHALSTVCLEDRDYPAASVSVVHSGGPDASSRITKSKLVNSQTRVRYTPGPCNSTKEAQYCSVTNPNTTTRTSASAAKRRVHDATRHRLRLHVQVTIPIRRYGNC